MLQTWNWGQYPSWPLFCSWSCMKDIFVVCYRHNIFVLWHSCLFLSCLNLFLLVFIWLWSRSWGVRAVNIYHLLYFSFLYVSFTASVRFLLHFRTWLWFVTFYVGSILAEWALCTEDYTPAMSILKGPAVPSHSMPISQSHPTMSLKDDLAPAWHASSDQKIRNQAALVKTPPWLQRCGLMSKSGYTVRFIV